MSDGRGWFRGVCLPECVSGGVLAAWFGGDIDKCAVTLVRCAVTLVRCTVTL